MAIGSIKSSVGFTDAANNLVANGLLTLQLSQPCEIISTGGLVDTALITIPLTSAGVISGNFSIWQNDQLTPSTTYRAKLYDANSNLVADFGQWSIAGTSPVDISFMIPSQSGIVSNPSPVLQSPAGNQTIIQPTGTDLFVNRFEQIRFADQFPSLQAAINDLPASGGMVILPSGTYAVNSAVTLTSNVNIFGQGCAQVDSVTGPTTITSTLASGDLFYLNGFNDCHIGNFSVKYTGSGANSCFRLTAAQRNVISNVYISGPFNNMVILDSSSTAAASCIWNEFRNIHTTGTAANGNGLVLNSADASAKVINSNYFYNFRATAGANGAAIWLTNSGVHNQVINENVFWASEVTGGTGTGTGLLVDQGSTRGCVFIDVNIEGNNNGLNKATANTLTFIGGNFSSNSGTNVTDAQPTFTSFINTNVGGSAQEFAVDPSGNISCRGVGVGGAVGAANNINIPTGNGIQASGNQVTLYNFASLGTSIAEQSQNGGQWIWGNNTELLTLSTSGTTTDTTNNLLPANSIIEAVVARVTTTITTATNWELGDATTAGRFSAPNSTMTAGTTQVGLVHIDQTGNAGPRQTSAAKVRVTTTGTPGAGAIRITVYYRQFTPPTS